MKNKGITLVALVITIIILLILVGVSINLIAGSNGILKKATNAVEIHELAAQKEQLQLDLVAAQADTIMNGQTQISQKTLTEIIEKYGELQEDGDTIVTKYGNISLAEIYEKSENGGDLIPDINEDGTINQEELVKLISELKTLKTQMSTSTTEIQTLKTDLTQLQNSSKTLDDIYPVGSIYISTNLATVQEVAQKLGGTWKNYADRKNFSRCWHF